MTTDALSSKGFVLAVLYSRIRYRWRSRNTAAGCWWLAALCPFHGPSLRLVCSTRYLVQLAYYKENQSNHIIAKSTMNYLLLLPLNSELTSFKVTHPTRPNRLFSVPNISRYSLILICYVRLDRQRTLPGAQRSKESRWV